MSQNDWSCLHDVYETLDSSDSNTAKKANYVLQTYWRDMTSDLNLLGLISSEKFHLMENFFMTSSSRLSGFWRCSCFM